MTVEAVDAAGNTRTCTFDIVIAIDENKQELLQTVTWWDYPIVQEAAPQAGLALFTHVLQPPTGGDVSAFQVRVLNVCVCVYVCVCVCGLGTEGVDCMCTRPDTVIDRERQTDRQRQRDGGSERRD